MEKRPPAWLWVVALVPTLVLGVLRWSSGPGVGAEDYAQYELHAHQLAHGLPYRDTGYLPSPLNAGHGPGVLPPGVPLVLAVAFKVAGEGPMSVRTAMMVLSIAFFLVAGLYFAVVNEPWLGLGVTLLVGLSPVVVRYSNLAQSDLPLCLAIWVVLMLADRPGAWSWRRVAAITVAGFAAMSFRLIGATIVPVMLLVAAIRWSELRWRGLVPPLVWMLAGAAGVAVIGASSVARNPSFLLEVFDGLGSRLLFYRIGAGEALVRPFPWLLANHVYQIVGLIACALGLLVVIRLAWRRAAVAFAVVYGGTLLVLPFTAPRYLWPLFPVLVFGFLKGVAWLALKLRPASSPMPVTLALAALIAVSASSVIAISPAPGWFATQPPAAVLFAEMRRLNAQQPLRASFSRPRILAKETGIHAMPLLNRLPGEIEGEFNRQCISHLVIGSLGLRQEHDQANRRLVAERPADFALLWSSADFQVYRYLALRPDNCPPTIPRAVTAQ